MKVPFYRQTLDFTCGPASLLMAIGAHDPEFRPTLEEEVDIWREATLGAVPATSRHGLALAALRRGFRARIVSNIDGIAFRRRIEARMPDFFDAKTLETLWEDRRRRAHAAGIPEERRQVTMADVEGALEAGEVPILLTSTVHFDESEDVPHWVVVGAREGDGFLVLNPLDEAPPKVHVPRRLMETVLDGYEGDQELVLVGPRASRGR